MQPAAHISTLVVWVLACNKSSGARYHKVTTFGDMGLTGKPNHLAKPKSAKINKIILLTKYQKYHYHQGIILFPYN